MLTEGLIIAVVLLFIYHGTTRPRNFPPGPRGLPLLGYIPFLSFYDAVFPYKALKKLGDVYGPVVGFYLGPRKPCVSVSGYDAVREALRNQHLDGRVVTPAILQRSFGKPYGVIFTEGEPWQEQRRFTLRYLRDLGFGKTSSEDVIMDDVNHLLHHMKSLIAHGPSAVVHLKNIFSVPVVNALWSILSGEKFHAGDTHLNDLLNAIEVFFRSGDPIRSNVAVPTWILRRFACVRRFQGNRTEQLLCVQKFLRDVIDEHEKRRRVDNVDSADNFIDIYLNEIEKQSNNPHSTFHKDQLISIILDIFTAGAETTSNSVGFAVLYLLRNPDIQQRMQEELDAVCGDHLPSLTQRSSLVYTEAVLMEALRLSNTAPMSVAHSALSHTQLRGYSIPKGCVVLINLYSVHSEVAFWTDPDVFRPERHLDPNGKLIKSSHLLPFGVGRRMCLGESLARNTYFLFTAALMKTFRFERVKGQAEPTVEPINGFTLGYQGFPAVVSPRF